VEVTDAAEIMEAAKIMEAKATVEMVEMERLSTEEVR
jgi:hypothetical protein